MGADHWDNETIVDEWIGFFSAIQDISFARKKVAIVGLGNCVLYPEHFAAGMADLYEYVIKKDAEVLGFVDGSGYDYLDSDAVNEDGIFCGLPIDEDNEPELTAERLEKWLVQLKPDFEL